MTGHDTPSSLLGFLHGSNGLRDGSNLIDLQQQASAGVLRDGAVNFLNVGHSQIISDHLELSSVFGREFGPVFPVILVERILDCHNGEVASEFLVQVSKGLARNHVPIILEVKVISVFSLDLEFRGGHVESDGALVLVTSLLQGLHDEFAPLAVVAWWGESTLVANQCSVTSELSLDDLSEGMVNLAANLHCLCKRRGAGGDHKVLLEGQFVSSVGPTIDHIETRHRHGISLLVVSSQLGVVGVERNALSGGAGLGDGEGYAKDGVGTEVTLVGCTVQSQHHLVNSFLVGRIQVHHCRPQHVVDIRNSFQHTLSKESVTPITKFDCFVSTCRCTRRNGSTENTIVCANFHLHGWVSSGIQNFSSLYTLDRRHTQ
mmetsp:Transcript_11132/g.25780  ORF Transcript_11132/g.25780 Transcript_11132/m.25780 type:complete len:374 (-) Transcript_11132:122-1243(-)